LCQVRGDRAKVHGTNFTDRKISLKRAVAILAKNYIEVNDSEAAIILNFLYHIAQNDNQDKVQKIGNLKG